MKLYYKILVVLFIVVFVSCSSGGSNASPQANIPLPSNEDPITVSSPDSTGYVTITGSSSAVPNDAIVLIEVVSGTSYLDFDLRFPDLIPSAYASTSCTSSLPECPTLSSDDMCQDTANADGSFTVQVPATTSDSLIISYLDESNNCSEVEAYGKEISDNIVSLGFDVVDSAYDSPNQFLYFLSTTSSSQVVGYDLETGTLNTFLMEVEGTPESINLVTDSNEQRYLVIKSSSETVIARLILDGDSPEMAVFGFVDSNGADLTDLDFLGANQFIYSDADTSCLSSSVFSGDLPYTRLFFQQDGYLYLMEFGDNLSDVNPEILTEGGDFRLRQIYMSFGILVDHELITDYQVDAIEEAIITGDYTTYVTRVDDDATGTSQHVVIRRPVSQSDSYCRTSLDFSSGDSEFINLGVAGGFSINSSSDSNGNIILAFLDLTNQALSLVDVGGESLLCAVSGELLFGDAEADVANTCSSNFDSSNGLLFTTEGLEVSDVFLVRPFIGGDSLLDEVFLVGKENGGSDFIVSDGTTSSSYETDVVSLISPIDILDDRSNDRMLLIDAGVSGDDSSNLVIYELNITE